MNRLAKSDCYVLLRKDDFSTFENFLPVSCRIHQPSGFDQAGKLSCSVAVSYGKQGRVGQQPSQTASQGLAPMPPQAAGRSRGTAQDRAGSAWARGGGGCCRAKAMLALPALVGSRGMMTLFLAPTPLC